MTVASHRILVGDVMDKLRHRFQHGPSIQLSAVPPEFVAPRDELIGVRPIGDLSQSTVAVREVTVADDLRSMISSAFLQSPKNQEPLGLLPLDKKQRQQQSNSRLSLSVCYLPCEQGPSREKLWPLEPYRTTKERTQEIERLPIGHANLDTDVVAGCLPALAGISLRPLDPDIPLTINNASRVGEASS